ncbi:MAG: hypothetical protein ABIQ39_13855 [Ilumatobacteraceae bacterium]
MTVSVEQVAVELARPTPVPPASDQWQGWIDRAYRLIEKRVGAVAYAALDPFTLDDVVVTAVAEHVRAWRDTSATRYTVAVDDGTVSRSYETAAGPLTISDDLWALLLGVSSSQSFTIGP